MTLYFNDNDLRNKILELADKYFYDFPLIINDVYFGKKSINTLGRCIPEDFKNNPLLNQNNQLFNSETTPSSISINSYFKELDVTETLIHEMCHSVNFSQGLIDSNHGENFKTVANIIGKRSGIYVQTKTTDKYLNTVLSTVDYMKKIKKDVSEVLAYRKIINSWKEDYKDLYLKFIDELSKFNKDLSDILSNFIENKDINSKQDCNECADLLDEIFPRNKQFRLWNLK